uniref:Uncharacterized protein n=1 Tax=Avena sativa TaxID=4498 RepID=A0ACD5Y055_AVESA
MEVVTGAMGSLLPKLGELLAGEYKLQKGVKKDIGFLESEMRSMQAALSKVGEVPWDQLDKQVKVWAGEVRELSYDMEDVVDNFLVRVEDSDPAANSNKIKQLMDEMTNLFTKGKARHEIANAVKDIKDRTLQVAARRDKYKVDGIIANTSSINNAVDPRLLALYTDQKELVGIEQARDELTKRLQTDGDCHASKQKLKIISICGPGGLGKTTLAKAVYDQLQTQYECLAFVPVGRNPEVKKILKDILLEVGKKKPVGEVATLDERQLIDKLRELLENERYFIVIDDVWDLKSWKLIKCALLDNNRGSRVIITTRILNVAKETGDVYEHKPLSDDVSKELFYTRLFGGKDKCPRDQPAEVTEKIIKKCRGIPLAIITIASLLAGKPMEDWSKVYTSIGFGHGDNTMKILSFSYYDLPSHLRPCLLHLSIFPEDSEIMKDTLIWKWIAEGFVAEQHGVGLFEIGERYFNELMNRSMILPVEDSVSYTIYACRVHDMVLDMICFLSNEQNFVTILDNKEKYLSSQSNPRRLALQTEYIEEHNPLANMCMPKLRSFYANRCHISVMPSLSSFQVLRVLDMKGCAFLRDCHLKHIGRLVQLRYLGLQETRISKLPEDIGDLRFLQSLDLHKTEIKELP